MAAEPSLQNPARSPSPASAPPVPSAPGPRATALQKLYADAIAHILKTCSYNNFAACFPTPAKEVPGSMKALHEQFNQKLGEQLKSNFDDILRERNVVGSLNEFDGLIDDARKRRAKALEDGSNTAPTPPHTLPAQQLYLSHLAPSLSQHSKELKERQDTVQAENVELLSRVMQQRKDIAAMMQGLDNVVSDLDASVAALEPGEIDALREEMRDVDEEMTMTI